MTAEEKRERQKSYTKNYRSSAHGRKKYNAYMKSYMEQKRLKQREAEIAAFEEKQRKDRWLKTTLTKWNSVLTNGGRAKSALTKG